MSTNNKTESTSPGTPAPRPVSPESPSVPAAWLLLCLGLVIIVGVQLFHHTRQVQQWDASRHNYSNQVASLEGKLAEQAAVNTTLESNLTDTRVKASNDLAAIEATLSTTTASLDKSRGEVEAAAAAMSEKDKKITALEGQNTELDKEAGDLRGSIAKLEGEIQATQKKLDAAQGDKKFLVAELARLQAQKGEYERKLNDLAYLQIQVKTLREDLAVSRRLDWIRRSIYDAIAQKGGERLIHPIVPAPPTTNSLAVELRQNGEIKIEAPEPAPAAPR